MQVQITGHHVEISPGLRSFVSSKLAKLEEYYPRVRKVAVVLSVEKYRHTAEIHFHAEGVEMSAKKTTKDMYASIEEALAAIAQQASKRKDRLRSQNARRKGKLAAKLGVGRGRVPADREEAPPEPPRPKVIRTRARGLKPMQVEDAIALLEAGPQPFVLFRGPQGEVQLLYRRDDGHYGLMEA